MESHRCVWTVGSRSQEEVEEKEQTERVNDEWYILSQRCSISIPSIIRTHRPETGHKLRLRRNNPQCNTLQAHRVTSNRRSDEQSRKKTKHR
jgi:hypothetical protein